MNSRGFEFSFGWLFAIIVGAAILVLAIYAATTFINTQRKIEDSSKSVELSALIRQLETGLEQSGIQVITAQVNTRINNNCAISGNLVSEKIFGVQSLKTSVSSSLGTEWNNDSIPLKSQSMYLFSNKTVEGKSFVVLSQRFSYPYKIGDMIIIWSSSDRYCFINAPIAVESTLTNLHAPGINFTTTGSRCLQGSKRVCFAQGGCDIDVSQTTKTVTKAGKTVYFDEVDSALFYGAVFGDPEIYECQAVRLARKAAFLSTIYAEKARFGMAYGCSAETLLPNLEVLGQTLNNTGNSAIFSTEKQLSEDLRKDNDALICPLF